MAIALLACGQFATVRAEPTVESAGDSPVPSAPAWVKIIDQGTVDPKLASMQTPEGIKVEIVAEEPTVVNPVALAFDDGGTPLVLEWRVAEESRRVAEQVTLQDGSVVTVNRLRKAVGDVLKSLADTDGDGRFDQANVLLDDQETPSTLLLHDGWLYTASLGSVTRRKFTPPDGKIGPPEEIVRGLCGFGRRQVSGLTMSHDGWLYITSGDDDNYGEGVDGSRATVLRTGAVFRCRPDGSRLQEVARGFCNPHRELAFDRHYNMFHADGASPDGERIESARLVHVLDGSDYGHRLSPAAAALEAPPASMPDILKTGRGAPAGLLIYQGTRFPTFFRGLLISPDPQQQRVQAYAVERAGGTFRVTEQFTLLSSPDPLFRPCQAVQGPDGAIYILDWRTDGDWSGALWGDGVHGRIYKLSWSGTLNEPAIPLGNPDAWTKIKTAEEETLWSLLDTPDFELRKRVQRELLARRGTKARARFLEVAASQGRSSPARVTALGAACQTYNRDVYEALIRLLKDINPEIRRAAAELLDRSAPTNSHEALAALGDTLADPHPAVARSAALAIGQLVALLPPQDTKKIRLAEQMRNALAACDREQAFLHDGMLRGLERMGPLGIEKLLLWAWSNDDKKCEAAVSAFEGLRTRDAANGLDRLLQGDTSFTDEQHARLMRCYRNIHLDPPISGNRLVEWLAEHSDAATEIRLAALETLALVGDDKNTAPGLAQSLLKHEEADARRGAARAIGRTGLVAAAPALLAALKEPNRDVQEQREMVAALALLRSRPAPITGEMSPPGVELILDDLLKLAAGQLASEARGDILALVGEVDIAKAEPVALKMLKSDDAVLAGAAIDVLGVKAERAAEVGRMFVAGKLDRALQPRVAAAVKKHADQEEDASGPFHSLLMEVME